MEDEARLDVANKLGFTEEKIKNKNQADTATTKNSSCSGVTPSHIGNFLTMRYIFSK